MKINNAYRTIKLYFMSIILVVFIFSCLNTLGCSKVEKGAEKEVAVDGAIIKNIIFEIEDQDSKVYVGEKTEITVTVKNSAGVPLPAGTKVTFTIDPNELATFNPSATKYTNSQGIVIVTIVPLMAGQVKLTATVPAYNYTSIEIINILVAPEPGTITLSISKNPLNINELAILTATVKDKAGNNMPYGTQILFYINPNDLGTFSDANAKIENDKGSVDINFMPKNTGTGTITSKCGEIEEKKIITINTGSTDGGTTPGSPPGGVIITRDPNAIIVAANPRQIPADGISTSEIQATVVDFKNNPLPNKIVRFTTTDGSITANAETDTAGIAKATLQSDYINICDVTVTVTCGTIIETTTVRFTLSTSSKFTLKTDKNQILSDGVDKANITARLLDEIDQPIKGVSICFTPQKIVATNQTIPGEKNNESGLETTFNLALNDNDKIKSAVLSFYLDYQVQSPTSNITLNGTTILSVIPRTYGRDQRIIINDPTILKNNDNNTLIFNFGYSAQIKNIRLEYKYIESYRNECDAQLITNQNGECVYEYSNDEQISSNIIIAALTGDLSAEISIKTNVPPQPPIPPEPPEQVANIEFGSLPGQDLFANGLDMVDLTVTVYDKYRIPISYATKIKFQITTNIGAFKNTDPNVFTTTTIGGYATAPPLIAPLDSLDTSRDQTVSVKALYIDPNDPTDASIFDTIEVPFKGFTLSAAPQKSMLMANGIDSTNLTAYLKNSDGVAISGKPVQFSTDIGLLNSIMPITDGTGKATITILSEPQKLGIANAKVKFGKHSVNVNPPIAFYYTEVATINLIATPSSLYADGTSKADIKATVMDPNNHPVMDGTPVLFTIVNGNADSGMIEPYEFTSGGVASRKYTAGTKPQSVTIQAACGNKTATMSITLQALKPASITLDASSIILEVGESTTATITATVMNNVGQPVGGVIVDFSTDLGGITPTATTDPNGIAKATFTAGTKAGAALIIANVENATGVIVISLIPGIPSNIILAEDISPNPDPERIYVKGTDMNQTSTLTFEVRDNNGNPIADNQLIEFILLNNGLGGSEVLKPSAGTDPDNGALTVGGRVKTTLQSGFKSGTVNVIAFIDSTNNGVPDEDEVQSVAIRIAISGGLPDGENFGVHPVVLNIAGLKIINLEDTITAKMSDRYHNPVPVGTVVYFTSNYSTITSPGIVLDTTAASEADATLISTFPLPPDGFVTIEASTQTGNWSKILCMERHPTDPNILYIGTDGGGIFKTTNAQSKNVQWFWVGRTDNGLTCGIVRDIKIDKNLTHILYAATDHGVFKSLGGGDAWENMGLPKHITGETPSGNSGILDITDADGDGLTDQAYTLSYASTTYRPKTKVYLNGERTQDYVFEGVNTIRFIVGGYTGLSDGARIIVEYQTGDILPYLNPVYAMVIDSNPADPINKSIIYAALYDAGVYKSTDGGFTWNLSNYGLSNLKVMSLAIDPTTTEPNARIYASTWGDYIFRSSNSAQNWTLINTGLSASVVTTLLIDPTNTSNIYAGTMLEGVFRSINRGNTWTKPSVNVNATDSLNTYVKDLAIDGYDKTLYAATYTDSNAPTGGVFKSTDHGDTWSRVTSLENNGVFTIALADKSGDDTIFAGAYKRKIFRSSDSGAAWERINSQSPDDLYRLFTTTQVLFSGDTVITITPMYATYQKYGTFSSLYNTEYQTFIYTVSDLNGNPLTAGTTINVTVSLGEVTGNVSESMPDTQYGGTVYSVTWANKSLEIDNFPGSLTVDVESAKNGSASATYTLTLIGIVSISPKEKNLKAPGGSINFIAKGGSNVPENYKWITTEGDIDPNEPGKQSQRTGVNQTILTTNITSAGQTCTVTVRDVVTNQWAEATITQEEAPELKISPATANIKNGGGSVFFTASGGSNDPTNYEWSTTAGALDTTIGKSVTLTTTAADDDSTVTVTLQDTLTNQSPASAKVEQKAD